jgi:hypothetical protein
LDVLCITEYWLREDQIDYYNFKNNSLFQNFVGKINGMEVRVFMLNQINPSKQISKLYLT